MHINIDLSPDRIADEVNANVGKGVETGTSVERWIRDNESSFARMLQDCVVGELTEIYE